MMISIIPLLSFYLIILAYFELKMGCFTLFYNFNCLSYILFMFIMWFQIKLAINEHNTNKMIFLYEFHDHLSEA